MRRILCSIALILFLPATILAADNEFAVQFTVPSNKDDVWNFVEMVSDLGYPAYMFTQDLGGGVVHYYAQMGTYADYDVARQAAEKLRKKVRVDYEIVHANTNKAVTSKDMAMLEQNSGGAESPPDMPEDTPEAPAEVMAEAAPEHPEVSEETPAAVAEPAAGKPAPAAKAPEKEESASDVIAFDEPTPKESAQPVSELAPQPAASPEPAPSKEETAIAPATAPQPVPQPEPMAVRSETPTGPMMYLAQLHSFSIKDNALKAAQDYSRRGYDPDIILLYDDSHTPWYVLSLGHWADLAGARAASRAFKSREGRSPTINQVDASFLKTRVVPY